MPTRKRSRSRSRRRSKKRTPDVRSMSTKSQVALQKASKDLLEGKDPGKVESELLNASKSVPDDEKEKYFSLAEKALSDPMRLIQLIGMGTTVVTGLYAAGKGAYGASKWFYKTVRGEESKVENDIKQFNEGPLKGLNEIEPFVKNSLVPATQRNKRFLNEIFRTEISTESRLVKALRFWYLHEILSKKMGETDVAHRIRVNELFVPLIKVPILNQYFEEIRKAQEFRKMPPLLVKMQSEEEEKKEDVF